jgi:hypothetical protein
MQNQSTPAFPAPDHGPMLRDVLVVHELLKGLAHAAAFVRDDHVIDDQAEFYDACCRLFNIKPTSDGYMAVVGLMNPTAFIGEFVKAHNDDLKGMGWL